MTTKHIHIHFGGSRGGGKTAARDASNEQAAIATFKKKIEAAKKELVANGGTAGPLTEKEKKDLNWTIQYYEQAIKDAEKKGARDAARLIQTETNGTNVAKVYWSSEDEEFCVKLYRAGVYQSKADYFTNEKSDALGTAKAMVKDSAYRSTRAPGLALLTKRFGDISIMTKYRGMDIREDVNGIFTILKNGKDQTGMTFKTEAQAKKEVDELIDEVGVKDDVRRQTQSLQEWIRLITHNFKNVTFQKSAGKTTALSEGKGVGQYDHTELVGSITV